MSELNTINGRDYLIEYILTALATARPARVATGIDSEIARMAKVPPKNAKFEVFFDISFMDTSLIFWTRLLPRSNGYDSPESAMFCREK
jgi:hypothetical protein